MITKELIIETATRLFMQHGVKSITIDRIVKELRTSKRTIYSHFEDKWTEKSDTDVNKRLFPIPQVAIDGASNTPGYLVQNKGY